MTNFLKRILVAGLAVICAARIIIAIDERESPSIGWILALSGIWGAVVWLWPAEWKFNCWSGVCRWLKWTSFLLAVCAGVGVGSNFAAEKWRTDPERHKMKQITEAALEGANAVRWYITPAETLYAEVKALRVWRKQALSLAGKEFLFATYNPTFQSDKAYAKWLDGVNKLDADLPEPFEFEFRTPGNKGAEPDSFNDVVHRYRASRYMQR